MPLTLAAVGEEIIIKRIGGNADVRAHLQNLGFVSGAAVTVVSSMGGNLIVNVKNARIAVSREMAQKIFVEKEVYYENTQRRCRRKLLQGKEAPR